jgi:hypothetical protein
LRRLCLQDQLDGVDIAELTSLCKDGAGAIPLRAEHLKDVTAASVAVTLKSLHTVKHVNALAAGESLTLTRSESLFSTATMALANQDMPTLLALCL